MAETTKGIDIGIRLLATTRHWKTLLHVLLERGKEIAPRGLKTREQMAYTSVVPMDFPVIVSKVRKLSYTFMAAEAYWILTGDNKVESIMPYSKKIADFSDDGRFFKGAYGPKVVDQLPYVIETLSKDEASRQAVLTVWRERPGPSKDIPCTVALQFILRDNTLNVIATMRSSDAWLGWVYDIFNFSMIGWYVISALNQVRPESVRIKPGNLYLTAGSQHLYEPNWELAKDCIVEVPEIKPIGQDFYEFGHRIRQSPESLMIWLKNARDRGVLESIGYNDND